MSRRLGQALTGLTSSASNPRWVATATPYLTAARAERTNRKRDGHQQENSSWTGAVLGCGFVAAALLRFKNEAFAATPIHKKPVGLREKYNFVSQVINYVSPAVVSIHATQSIGRRHLWLNEVQSQGSGFFVDEKGLVITNAHVVANASELKVRTSDGREYKGRVVAADESVDLAVIKLLHSEGSNVPYIELSKRDEVEVGEWVVAVGSPFTLNNTFTVGIVSNKCRPSSELGISRNQVDYIQTDASINIGNSGGPLVNLDGEVIGVNTMRLQSDGISFAIPVARVKSFLDSITSVKGTRKEEEVGRRWIGVMMITLSPDVINHFRLADRLGLDESTRGVIVHQVTEGSPAQQSGIRPGDVITHGNGKAICSAKELMEMVNGSEVLEVVVLRGGESYTARIMPQLVLL